MVGGLLADLAFNAVSNLTGQTFSAAELRKVVAAATSEGVVLSPPSGYFDLGTSSGDVERIVAAAGRSNDDRLLLVFDLSIAPVGRGLAGYTLNEVYVANSSNLHERVILAQYRDVEAIIAPQATQKSDAFDNKNTTPTLFEPAVRAILTRLADGDVSGLAAEGIWSGVGDLLMWVREYGPNGATIVPMPTGGWATVQGRPVSEDGRTWGLMVPIWTAEDGQSELTLLLNARQEEQAVISVVIKDLRVM